MHYVLSDIHGYHDKYKAMLAEISLQATDTLFVLGDVIDRGPDGIKILRDMMERPNVIPILGNHEFTAAVCLSWLMEKVTNKSLDSLSKEQLAAFSEWLNNGGEPTLRALKLLCQEERKDVLEYIREMEVYVEVTAGGRDFVLVHAGLEHFSPGRPLEDYALSDFLFDRPNLNRDYFADKILVFGHTPTRIIRQWAGRPPADTILRWGNQIGIDCGCGSGCKLGCLCLETLEEFYV